MLYEYTKIIRLNTRLSSLFLPSVPYFQHIIGYNSHFARQQIWQSRASNSCEFHPPPHPPIETSPSYLASQSINFISRFCGHVIICRLYWPIRIQFGTEMWCGWRLDYGSISRFATRSYKGCLILGNDFEIVSPTKRIALLNYWR